MTFRRSKFHVRTTTAMDGLAHWIGPWCHRRVCDEKPVHGLNHVTHHVTCLACVLFFRSSKGKRSALVRR